jgi:hypothetical protein
MRTTPRRVYGQFVVVDGAPTVAATGAVEAVIVISWDDRCGGAPKG